MKKIISAILALTMCISFMGGITVSAAVAEKEYFFAGESIAALNGYADISAFKKDKNNLNYDYANSSSNGGSVNHTSAKLFIGSGKHGFYFFDHSWEPTTQSEVLYFAQVGDTEIKHLLSRTQSNYTVSKLSTSYVLVPPETAGFYTVSTIVNGTPDVYVGTLDKTKTDKNVDDYVKAKYLVGTNVTTKEAYNSGKYNELPGKLIYTDGSSELVIAYSQENPELRTDLNFSNRALKLTQVTGTPTFAIDNANLDILDKTSVPNSAKISVKLGSNDVLNGFVTYSVKDGKADVASVDENGNVTAISGGSEVIVASVGDYSKEFTVKVEDKLKYVYGFVQSEHYNGDSSKISYTGVTYFPEYTSENYTDGERNWKYYAMTDGTLAKYNEKIENTAAADLPKALRNIVGFDTGGLRFTPASGGEWLALKFRVPEAGIYKVSYTASANASSLNTRGYISIMDGSETKDSILDKSNGPVTSDYLLQYDVDFNNSSSVNEEREIGTKVIATNEDGDELLFILTARSGYTSAMRMRSFTLTKVEDVMQLSADSVELEAEGETTTVTATLAENTLIGYMRPSYKIADTEVATVNVVGKITPKTAGETTLTVTIGDKSKTIPVVVKAKEVPAETPEYVEAFTPDATTVSPVTNSVAALAIAKDGSSLTVTKSAEKNADGTYSVTTDAESGEYKFLYWAKGLENGGKKRIVSFNASFKYAPHNGANYLIAVYGKEGDVTARNEYYNANGQLLEDNATLPSMAGYGTAKGWVDCGDGIFVAEYDDTPVESFNITVNGKTDTYVYGEEVVCKANAKSGDKVFFGWRKTINGKTELVSINTEYSFNAWEDCTVEAVYADEAGVFSGIARKIILGTFKVGGKNAVMAEFIGFNNVAEKGISLGNSDFAMSTNGNQFTIINDIDATDIGGYAILNDGTKVIFKK